MLEHEVRETVKILEAMDAPEVEETLDFIGFRNRTERVTNLLIAALFPRHAAEPITREGALKESVRLMQVCLNEVVPARRGEEVIRAMLASLPEIRRQLQTDLVAAYQGDPAAKSLDEVILCYPAFLAISTYRIAHVLYCEEVPLMPRVMTEYAHRMTGIDIHPGATIGDSFFIDHGTGVVIGETTTIGKSVKLYQHVTLGAKSFEVGEDGTLVKGIKRHPDIGDRVVIYSGATVLGGRTSIGSDSVIGGSVWLTHSIPSGKMVLANAAVTDSTQTRDITNDDPVDSAKL